MLVMMMMMMMMMMMIMMMIAYEKTSRYEIKGIGLMTLSPSNLGVATKPFCILVYYTCIMLACLK